MGQRISGDDIPATGRGARRRRGVASALAVAVLAAGTLTACAPDPAPVGPAAPTVGDDSPSSRNMVWIGDITVRYEVAPPGGRATTNVTTYHLGPEATARNQASWTSRYEHLEERSSSCGPNVADTYYFRDHQIGEGHGGPGVVTGTSYSGPQGIWVEWVDAHESFPAGYSVGANALSQSQMGMIPTTRTSTTKPCFRDSITSVSYPEMRVEFGGTYVTRYPPPPDGVTHSHVISPKDDRFILEAANRRASGSSGIDGMSVSFRLRRKDCTGVPDTDSDGYDDCVEFDAGTDWDDRASHPATWDGDGDGVVDPKDWCPREGGFVLASITAGCPIGRGPRIAGIVPVDWRGSQGGYTLSYDPNRTQPGPNGAQVSGFPYAKSSTFTWNFGDGHTTSALGADIAGPATHTYSRPGRYVVTLKVTDPAGRSFTQATTLEFTGDPLVDFAPEVRLHPDERNHPMHPDDFVAASKLMWRIEQAPLGDCLWVDQTVAAPPAANRLGAGDAGTRYTATWQRPCSTGTTYTASTNRFTRPNDANPERGLLPSPYGFFLDFDTERQPASFRPVPAWTQTTDRPYPQFSADDTVNTYWFFYGYNDAPGPGVSAPLFDHEGDWEHFNVHLHRTLHVPLGDGFGYYQHNGGEHRERRTAVSFSGWLHPVVYSAVGSHASYPSAGEHNLDLAGVTYAHDLTGDGLTWRTWADGTAGLPEVTAQPWYGYAGAWGVATDFKNSTGPLGPSVYKNPL